MSVDDITAVYDIEKSVCEHGWSEGILRDCLNTVYLCKTIWIDDLLIGYAIISIDADESHLLNLAIAPEFQRRGLGGKVLQILLNLVRERGAKRMFLEVRESNSSAIALYLDEGFNQIGIRNGYYPADSGRENAVIMALSFGL